MYSGLFCQIPVGCICLTCNGASSHCLSLFLSQTHTLTHLPNMQQEDSLRAGTCFVVCVFASCVCGSWAALLLDGLRPIPLLRGQPAEVLSFKKGEQRSKRIYCPSALDLYFLYSSFLVKRKQQQQQQIFLYLQVRKRFSSLLLLCKYLGGFMGPKTIGKPLLTYS